MSLIFDEIRPSDLSDWAERMESVQWMPSLLRQLVLASGASLQSCRFLTHEQINLAGWDGVVDATSEALFVPNGPSGWELSKRADVVQKANEDIEARTVSPGEITPSEATFVVATLRIWPGRKLTDGTMQSAGEHKAAWAREQQATYGWKRVVVLDAVDLAAWVSYSAGVGLWLAEIMHHNVRGARSLVAHWSELATLRSGITPATFLAGRQAFAEALDAWLAGPATAFEVPTLAYDDLRDTVTAWWTSRVDTEQLTRITPVAVTSEEAWTALSQTTSPLLLLADVGLELKPEQISAATTAGHFVIYRTSAAHPRGSGRSLPPLNRDFLAEELQRSGMASDEAWRIARDIAGSGVALKRILSTGSADPEWAKPPHASALAPVVLLGSWDSRSAGDRERVAAVFQRPYEEIETLLEPWVRTNDPLMHRTEHGWRVVTHADAWRWLSPMLRREHYEHFREAAHVVLTELNPRYDLPADQRIYANLRGAEARHSLRLRKAVGETLCFLTLRAHGNDQLPSPADFARGLAVKVFEKADDWRLWASLDDALVFIAEATPEVFLKAVEDDLRRTDPATMRLFQEAGSGVFSDFPYAELMWALQALLWDKQSVMRVVLVLSRMAARDPGGQSSPRPIGVLREAFLPWLPQCCLTVEERCRALDQIMSTEPEIGWKLFLALLPKHHDVSSPIHRPTYRQPIDAVNPQINDAEYWRQVDHVARKLVEAVGSDPGRWEKLIEKFGVLPIEAFDQALTSLERLGRELGEPDRTQIWEGLRHIAVEHRFFVTADWIMSPQRLEKIESVAAALQPADPISRNAWLFSTPRSHLPGTTTETPHEVEERMWDEARVTALREIFASGGLGSIKTILSRTSGMNAGKAGVLAAQHEIVTADAELLPSWLESANPSLEAFARGYADVRFRSGGWTWLHTLHPENWSPPTFADLSIILPFRSETWAQIEIIGPNHVTAYWQRIGPWMHGASAAEAECAVTELLKHERALAALECVHSASHHQVPVTIDSLISVIEALRIHFIRSAERPDEESPSERLETYTLAKVFESIQEAPNLTPEQSTRTQELEWFFLPLLNQAGRPRLLLRRSRAEPSFFVELHVAARFWPDELPREQRGEITDAQKSHAKNAQELLDCLRRLPGTLEDGSLDETAFRAWVKEVQSLATDQGFPKSIERRLGKLLLNSPMDAAGFWPCAAVCRYLTEEGTDAMLRSLRTAIFNNQGWPGPSGDGAIMSVRNERQEAVQNLKAFAVQIELEFPIISALLRLAAKEQEEVDRRFDHDD